jgi:PAS domain S-box-containing protein
MTSTIAHPIQAYGSLIEAIPCSAVVVDRSGLIHYANERLCALLRRSRPEIEGRDILSFYDSEDARAHLRARLADFDNPYEGEFHVPADGAPSPVMLCGRPLGTAPPLSEFALITLFDLSSQKKAEADRREELETMSRLSDTILAQALELKHYSERLEERVRERTRELHEANMEAIFMLAVASEAKDADTGAHVRRIEALSRTIACELGMSESDAERIGYSAILHDVGKMLVPDKILKKPGPLDGDERGAMQLHAIAGERILSKKPFFEVARQIARSHHENWDGSGYPDRLSGADIPLAARIVHLADVYDALIHARVYKPSWTPQQAMHAITEGGGRMFDPDVVRAFRSVVELGKFSTLRT